MKDSATQGLAPPGASRRVAAPAAAFYPLGVAISIYLESDSFAWVLDLPGCAAVADGEAAALGKVPAAIAYYRDLVRRHGSDVPAPFQGEIRAEDLAVIERASGDEVICRDDRRAVTPPEIERTIDLLAWTRADLHAVLCEVPAEAFDWDPPYPRGYPESWARWRTIREILGHIAICENRYYLRQIGHDPGPDPPADRVSTPGSREWYAAIAADWRALLDRTRNSTVGFLSSLALATDRSRVKEGQGQEAWSVRKVLRRLVWHEICHTKNIRRIAGDFATARVAPGRQQSTRTPSA